MPFNKDWIDEAQEDLDDSPIDEKEVTSVEEEIRRLYDEEAAVWKSPAWAHIDAILATEFARETQIMFSVADPQELLFARERGKLISRLRKRPEEVAARLQSLARRRRVLLGEEEATEE